MHQSIRIEVYARSQRPCVKGWLLYAWENIQEECTRVSMGRFSLKIMQTISWKSDIGWLLIVYDGWCYVARLSTWTLGIMKSLGLVCAISAFGSVNRSSHVEVLSPMLYWCHCFKSRIIGLGSLVISWTLTTSSSMQVHMVKQINCLNVLPNFTKMDSCFQTWFIHQWPTDHRVCVQQRTVHGLSYTYSQHKWQVHMCMLAPFTNCGYWVREAAQQLKRAACSTMFCHTDHLQQMSF